MVLLESLARAAFGMAVLIGICYLFSMRKKQINWRTIFMALLLQVVTAILMLKIPIFSSVFDWLASLFVLVLDYARYGSEFLFGSLVTKSDSFGYIFAIQVLPTIIFFSALSSILYYMGVLQVVVKGMAWVMAKTMKLSGPESLSTAGNIFLGQTEAPLLIKPYIEKMTRSEILCIMTGGMATIAGGVFAAYIGFLGGDDPEARVYFAKHLLTASIIAAPATIMASKLLLPETEKVHNESSMEMVSSDANNVLDAIASGTTDGVKLAINVGVMLLVFTALVYLANGVLLGIGSIGVDYGFVKMNLNTWVQSITDGRYEGFNFTFLLGVIFSPLAWLLGVPGNDIMQIGQLLGQKTMINEFVAYAELNKIRDSGVEIHPKSILIATYALCGFSNFASIGIQIGGIGSLAPGQRKTLTELGMYALIGGTIATFFTAIIAGTIYDFGL
jgi:CNT family concentrative nucleoside transporter